MTLQAATVEGAWLIVAAPSLSGGRDMPYGALDIRLSRISSPPALTGGCGSYKANSPPHPSPLPQVRPGERGKDTRTPKEREGLVSDPKRAEAVQGRGNFKGTRPGEIPRMSLTLMIGIESIQTGVVKQLDKALHHRLQSRPSFHQTA